MFCDDPETSFTLHFTTIQKMDLKEKLKNDYAFGTLVASTSPHFINATKGGGVDYVFIDTEHIPIDREKLSWMCRTYSGMGITPICRVPEPDAFR